METHIPALFPASVEDLRMARVATVLPTLIDLLPLDQQYVGMGYFCGGRSVRVLASELECAPDQAALLLATAMRTLRQILCG